MTLYDSLHDVLFRFNTTEKTRNIRITVEVDKQSILGKTYSIRLTDDSDAVFLFNVLIGEEDFNILKTEQGLRADFENFPNHLINKLKYCLSNPLEYYLVLDNVDIGDSSRCRTGCSIQIIERSDFKDTCLIKFRIASGSEEDVRNLLCSNLCRLKHQLKLKNDEYTRIYNENNENLGQLREKERLICELELRINEEVDCAKAHISNKLERERAKWEGDVKNLESTMKVQVTDLETRIALLDFKNTRLNDEKKELENTISIRRMKLEIAEKELERSAETNCKIINENTVLNEKLQDLTGKLASITNLKGNLERDVAQLKRVLYEKERECKLLQDNSRKLKSRVDSLERENSKLSEEIRTSVNQINELNKEVIYVNEKKKSLLEVAALLENQKETYEDEIKRKANAAYDMEQRLAATNKELEENGIKLKEMVELVALKEKELKKQVDVNTYLHRKLNDKELANNTCPDPAVNDTKALVSAAQTANRSLPPWLTASTPTLASNNKIDSRTNKSSAYFPSI